jgi:ECF transporter S component (folate family)
MCAEGGFFMSKNKKDFFGLGNIRNLKVISTLALLAAISIVLGKFLAINISESIRLSFENLTIILSGIMFGPIAGMITGIVSDSLGCLLYGYALNPVITLGAVTIGFISGILYKILSNINVTLNIAITVGISHLIGSVIVKTIGLCIWYDMPFFITLGWRSINYLIVGTAEFVLITILMRNNGFKSQINRLIGG